MSLQDERRRLAGLKPNLERRAIVFQFTRSFFAERGFLEVETPVRVSAVAPEQHISPFESESWFLSTSPELHMKRMLAAGYEKLFQISRCFRKGELGRQHNPEFTMLEWYRVGADYGQMIADTEDLVVTLARQLGMGTALPWGGKKVDVSPPWTRITVREAFSGTAGWDPIAGPDPLRFDTDLVTRVIPNFDPGRPVVLEGYPASMASLARLSATEAGVAERAEVFIGGLELANAYSELIDPGEQRRRFEEEVSEIRRQGRKVSMPHRFLEAVSHLPECGGIALGMDRLAMLLCGTDSIADVMAFSADNI